VTQDRPRQKVTIIGDGQMGIVFALMLETQGTAVTLWGRSSEHVADLIRDRESRRHLPGVHLPESITITASESDALIDTDLIVCAVPTQFIRPVFVRLVPHVPAGVGVVSASKGIENNSLLRPTAIIADVLGAAPRPYATLCGPTIAEELTRRLPATMVAACESHEFAVGVQGLFSVPWMRIYTLTDVIGVELAGATKNVVAIAAGILDGLEMGYNAKSALLARGLAEITRLGVAMGASPETFFGIAGVGDLATTCFSPVGRNRSCGEALGRGRSLDEYLQSRQSVVEGVATTKSVVAMARAHNIEMPITQAVHAVLFDGLSPARGIARLMEREPKPERIV
jgi:glycerol-3-phosphate dehydrogenase (NAD(P)+)